MNVKLFKPTPSVLQVSVANELQVPYSGTFEDDVEIWRQNVSSIGILVRKDNVSCKNSVNTTYVIPGMSILRDLQEFQSCRALLGIAKLAGHDPVLVSF